MSVTADPIGEINYLSLEVVATLLPLAASTLRFFASFCAASSVSFWSCFHPTGLVSYFGLLALSQSNSTPL